LKIFKDLFIKEIEKSKNIGKYKYIKTFVTLLCLIAFPVLYVNIAKPTDITKNIINKNIYLNKL
tara:strand:+ start:25 stop:216 length:192 start_codon:yes stop_codon:yes gene_type:complete